MDYLEQYQPSWNCLLDMFDQMVNADESYIFDTFGEPQNNVQVKPNLSLSIAKTTEKLTQFYRAKTTVKEEKTTSAEKIEILITETEKDFCSSSWDSFEDQKRKYILKKEKKEKKKNKAKKEPYPTKNFLLSFRTSDFKNDQIGSVKKEQTVESDQL